MMHAHLKQGEKSVKVTKYIKAHPHCSITQQPIRPRSELAAHRGHGNQQGPFSHSPARTCEAREEFTETGSRRDGTGARPDLPKLAAARAWRATAPLRLLRRLPGAAPPGLARFRGLQPCSDAARPPLALPSLGSRVLPPPPAPSGERQGAGSGGAVPPCGHRGADLPGCAIFSAFLAAILRRSSESETPATRHSQHGGLSAACRLTAAVPRSAHKEAALPPAPDGGAARLGAAGSEGGKKEQERPQTKTALK
ncbi:uncharacterized protein LOC135452057 [Zonotrichia leucophrys gambelii]|uniref:uncharacterized protein LOC135452057 n=1 Tax=Zonotrichia leucophrys gambelii TaxID=257770 RepID=UPI0031400E08